MRLFLLASCLVASTALASGSGEPLFDPQDQFWATRAPAVFQARFVTDEGDFVVEVHRQLAAVGVDRFYNLVRSGFYDNSRFFRVREGYIVQFGIAGDPAVSAVWRNRQIDDDAVRLGNTRGTLAFAMTGPDTRMTQIYINLVNNTHLDEQGFSPLGQVIEGMDVVDRLYSGYGEEAGGGMRLGKQGAMFEGGNDHLDKAYPLLSKLVTAKIE